MTTKKRSSVFKATIECSPAAKILATPMRLEEVTLVYTGTWILYYDMQCNLISPSPTPRATAVAIICRLSHTFCLPVTPALSAAPLELFHPTQVEPLLPVIPDDMADTRCCYCYVPASRSAQETTTKTTWKTEEEQQRQPKRQVLHMPQAISDVLNIGWAHLTVGPST